jgi:hypothetical protein
MNNKPKQTVFVLTVNGSTVTEQTVGFGHMMRRRILVSTKVHPCSCAFGKLTADLQAPSCFIIPARTATCCSTPRDRTRTPQKLPTFNRSPIPHGKSDRYCPPEGGGSRPPAMHGSLRSLAPGTLPRSSRAAPSAALRQPMSPHAARRRRQCATTHACPQNLMPAPSPALPTCGSAGVPQDSPCPGALVATCSFSAAKFFHSPSQCHRWSTESSS